MNRQLGYDSPADIVNRYPQFYWNSVAPQIQTAIRYLNMTSSGRQWIGNLYGNVFRAEREITLSGRKTSTQLAPTHQAEGLHPCRGDALPIIPCPRQILPAVRASTR